MGDESAKWCNYRTLAKQFIRPGQNLVQVYYFTAYATWKPERAQRHEKFIAALQGYGVTTILGRFKEVTRYCGNCRSEYKAHEEKESDVNLASHLLHLAHINAFNTALIMSADSDYASAIKLSTESFPEKRIGVIFPVGQRRSDKLANTASFVLYMKKHHIRNSLLPQKVELKSGRTIIRPDEYA